MDVSLQKSTKVCFSITLRALKISRSKKSEQYCRDKLEIFIRLFDEHFVRHFESHRRET